MRTNSNFKSAEIRHIQEIILDKTGVGLKKYYLVQTLTRSSYSRQSGGWNNECLEFIGDSILSYYAVKAIDQYFGHCERSYDADWACGHSFPLPLGRISELKNKLVSNAFFASIIDEWGLSEYLVVGRSDMNNNMGDQVKIKADLFEAVIGAIAVQYNWNQEKLESAISKAIPFEKIFKEETADDSLPVMFTRENAVTVLKELFEHEHCSLPSYELTGPDALGYYENGNPKWFCMCRVSSWGLTRLVASSSKKLAKQCAAYLVLCEHYNEPNMYGPSSNALLWYEQNGNLSPDLGSKSPYFSGKQ